MRGITITYNPDRPMVELDEILAFLGKDADESMWALFNVEALGNSAQALHQISDGGIKVSGIALRNLASDVLQVIDGRFEAYREGAETPWLLIRAVDGSAFDVETENESILKGLKNSFGNVSDLPD